MKKRIRFIVASLLIMVSVSVFFSYLAFSADKKDDIMKKEPPCTGPKLENEFHVFYCTCLNEKPCRDEVGCKDGPTIPVN